MTNKKQGNILLHREREEDREMAAFLQSKFSKTLAAKGESNHPSCASFQLKNAEESWVEY